MLKIEEVIETDAKVDDTLTLAFEYRQKSRQRVCLDSGEDAGLLLPHGTVLRGGNLLLADDGRIIEVIAALEKVSLVRSDDLFSLMRACYHLGNRHIPLQIDKCSVCYRYDPVFDEMVKALGLTVIQEQTSFEPESGAYNNRHSHDY